MKEKCSMGGVHEWEPIKIVAPGSTHGESSTAVQDVGTEWPHEKCKKCGITRPS